jgi:hypothetical protein
METSTRSSMPSQPPLTGRVNLHERYSSMDLRSLAPSGFDSADQRRRQSQQSLTLRPIIASSSHPFSRSHREWRGKVPFAIPPDPQLMSYYPQLVHSAVLRSTNDIGVVAANVTPRWIQLVDGTPAARGATFTALGLLDPHLCLEDHASHHARRNVISRDVDRGLLGMSLSKRSMHFQQCNADRYPGIAPVIGNAATRFVRTSSLRKPTISP